MILDRLEHAARYRGLGPLFVRAIEWLERHAPALPPAGRHEIEGRDLFAMVHQYPGKPIERAFWEAHRRYADVQYVHAGRERMGVAPLAAMRVKTPYESERDLVVLEGAGDFVTLGPGQFAIFFPQDAHMPGLEAGGGETITKVVLKVRLEAEGAEGP